MSIGMEKLHLLLGLLGSILSIMTGDVSSDRLHCLQFEQGKEEHNTPWRRDFISEDPLYQMNQSWVYSSDRCPLHQFSEEAFCTRGMQCGKHMLLVGDSTVSRFGIVLRRLASAKERLTHCLTDNFCVEGHQNPESAATCQITGHVERIQGYELCDKFCPPGKPVHITYVRHDYLTHIHGEKNYWSAICEQWKNIAHRADYVLISVGPHVHSMLTYPFGRHPPPDFNETAFFEQEAADTTALLSSILKPNATLIYRTGAVGVQNFSRVCAARPLDTIPVIASMYSWDKIPLLNAAYIRHLQGGLGLGLGQRANYSNSGNGNASTGSGGTGTGAAEEGRSVLVMDTTTLMSKIYGCRDDYMHFLITAPDTPVLLEWLILYNLLLEHNRQRESSAAATH